MFHACGLRWRLGLRLERRAHFQHPFASFQMEVPDLHMRVFGGCVDDDDGNDDGNDGDDGNNTEVL